MKRKFLHSKMQFGILFSGCSRLAIRTMATVALLLLCSTIWAQTKIYVDVSAGGSNTGNSWGNAYTSLKDAINAASEGDEIWVAAGTYKPTTDNDPNISFSLKSGVAIYGGFAGTETSLNERNWTNNVTILSGDIGTIGDNTDNSNHVIYNDGVSNTAILDGFTITKGNSIDGGGIYNSNSSPVLRNLIIQDNYANRWGGGIYIFLSSPTITNCIITGNKSNEGGGIYIINSSPTITNCIVTNNESVKGGGLCNNSFAFPTLTNCTISGNSAAYGGGVYNVDNSNSTLNNTIVWGNTANTAGQQLNNMSGTITLNNSCYGNETDDVSGILTTNDHCITNDPIFINPRNNFRLAVNSPCLDAGNNSYNDQPTDIRGDNFGRKLLKIDANITGTIDMGAYEFKKGTDPETLEIFRLYVNANVSGGNGDGKSWANAYKKLQDAINFASEDYEIWVAAGSYYPTNDNNRSISFNLKSGVAIYGGFAGTETSLSERNYKTNETILSGDIGTTGDNTDNSYHVIYNDGVSNTSILDGFTITKGHDSDGSCGSGIYNSSSSPQLSNLIITGNYTTSLGGGIYNFSSSPTITNCNITNNNAFYGGGICNNDCPSLIINNSTITSNTAESGGGGMYNINYSSPIMNNCTISDNAAVSGGGIYNDAYGATTLNNTIVWVNRASFQAQQFLVSNGPIALNNSCYGNEANDVVGTLTTTNCITSDPIFINPYKDFRLAANSPCIDAGNNSYNDQPTDIRGTGFDRKLSKNDASIAGTIDMGAYEFKKGIDPETTEPLRLFVNENVSGGTGDGRSWANAYPSLKQAITDAKTYYEIWVAAGTYYPTTDGDRNVSFSLKNGVAIYGGFAGTETSLNERNWTNNVTILSGDIGTTGDNTDNSYYVIYNNGVSNTAILDGFTITKGYTNNGGGGSGICNTYSSPQLRNLTITENYSTNYGGGIYNENSSPSIINCIITKNTANMGSGICNTYSSSPTITNCRITNNLANFSGGGIYNYYLSSPILTNCTVSSNSATSYGGGVYNDSSDPTLNNTIVWGNTASVYGQQLNNYSGTITLNNSCYGNEANDVSGTLITNDNCITSDPEFVDVAGSDFRILGISPCKNSGDNSYNSTASDIRGQERIQNTTIDMGAYEWTRGVDPEPFISIAATTQAAEDATNGQFTISVDKALKIDLTVNLTLSGTATDGIDMNTMAKSVVIPAGSLSVTTPVELIPDAIAEGDETVTLTLGTNSGVPIGATVSNSPTNNEATVTITDNDTSVEVSIAATTPAEEDATNGFFTVSVDKKLSTDLTVNLTLSGTADDGVDMDNLSTSVLIPAGEFSVTTPVNVINDNLVEDDETVIYTLGDNSGAPIGVSVNNSLTAYQDVVTITDDDYATLRVTKIADAYENISNGVFSIITDKQFNSNVDVNISVSGTAIAGADYSPIVLQQIFPANTDALTVTVAQLDDSDSEINEYVILKLVSTNNTRVSIAPATDDEATVTVFDDETIQLSVEDPVLTLSKVYDGNATAAVIPGLLKNLVSGDDVILEATATYNDAEAGADKTITVSYSISGTDVYKYSAPESFVVNTAEITPATLTVTAHNQSKVYGEPNPALTFEYSGFVNNDDVTDLDAEPDVVTNIYEYSNAGSYPSAITFTGGWDNNYEFDFVYGDFEITKATLTVVADGQTKVYGESNPELTFYYEDWINGEESIDVAPSISTTIDETSDANYYTGAITLNGGSDNNYTFDFVNGNFEISKAMLTVTAHNQSKVYGQPNPVLTIEYDGFMNGDNANDLDEQPVAVTDIDEYSDADYYNEYITFSGGSDNNYDFSFVNGDFEITQATLTVTAHNQSKVYGDFNPALTFKYSGFVNNDDATDLEEQPAVVTNIDTDSNAGSYPDAITFWGGWDNNYEFDFVYGDFEITKATLTVVADGQTKVYGESNPELTFYYEDWANGEESIDVAPSISTTIDETSDANYYTGAITLNGGSDNNYTFVFEPGDFEITKAPLTVTAHKQTKVYGQLSPALTIEYDGFVNEDDANDLDEQPVAVTDIDEYSDADYYNEYITFSGGSDNNYDFSFVNGDFEITQATLTVTAHNQSKVYGESNPVLTFEYDGFVNNDDAAVLDDEPVAVTDINTYSDAGSYPAAITFSGGIDNNYEFDFVDGDFEITKAPLTVIADDQTKVYGESNPVLTLDYIGFVNLDNADDLDLKPIASSLINELSNVGSYSKSIILSGGEDNNYEYSLVNGDFEITKAQLEITADNKSKVYGQSDPEFTISFSGFVNGDDTSDLTILPTINLDGDGVNVGEYDILVAGAQADNYSVNYHNGKLNVEKAVLTVRADNKSAYYNQPIPELTITYSGFEYGEDVSNLTTVPTASTTALKGSPEGDYDIDVSGGVANNYSFNYVKGVLTISPKQVPVLSWSAPADIQYGTPLSSVQLNAVAIVGADTIDGTFDYTPALETVLHTGNLQALHVAFTPDNDALYELVSGDNTINVTKAPLTVIAVNDTIVYGEPIPELNISYSGFVNGDDAGDLNVEPAASLATGDGINAGDYTILLSATSSDDYEITYQTGVFVVEKATLTVTAHNQHKVYGESNPVLTFEYDGFVNNDDVSVLDEKPIIGTAINELSNADYYTGAITFTGCNDNNYKFDFVPGDFEITKATLAVTAHNQRKVYGENNPMLTFEYSGFVNGDDIADLDEEPAVVTDIDEYSNAGSYSGAITFSGGSDNNYKFDFVPGNFEITKATLTAKADNMTKVYGAQNPVLSISYSGFVNGDDASSLDIEPTISTTIDQLTNAGLYSGAITLSGGTDNNYGFILVDGDFLVTKAILTVKANSQSKEYGDINPYNTFYYKGWVNGVEEIDVEPVMTTTVDRLTPAGMYSSAILISGASDNNYDFNYIPGTYRISQAPLKVTVNPITRQYGDDNPAYTFSFSGWKNNDSVIAVLPEVSTDIDRFSAVGQYPGALHIDGGRDNNYLLTRIDGDIEVVPAMLTVKAIDQFMTTGQPLPELSLSISGFVNGESESVIEALPTASTTASSSSEPGSYTISVSGGSAQNYYFEYVDASLTISGKQLPVVSWVTPESIVYGTALSNIQLNAISSVPGSFSYSPASGVVLGAGNGQLLSLTFTPHDTNTYQSVSKSVPIDVLPALLTVTALDQHMVAGLTLPEFLFAVSGFVNGDSISAIEVLPTASTIASPDSPAGSYPISIGGARAANYVFDYIEGILTISDKQLPVVTWGAPEAITYGTPLGNLQLNAVASTPGDFSYSPAAGVVLGAGMDQQLSLTFTPHDTAAFFAVKQSVNIDVLQAVLTVTANDLQMVYGEMLPALTCTVSGFVNGDSSVDLGELPVAVLEHSGKIDAGSYSISTQGGSAENYSFVYQNGSLTVGKATITVTALDASMKRGQQMPVFEMGYLGFKNGDGIADIDHLPEVATSATNDSPAGTYLLTPDGARDNNYSFVYVNGSLTIEPGVGVLQLDRVSVSVFPNPFSDGLTIETTDANAGHFSLCNLAGQVLRQGELCDGKNFLHLADLRNGVYLVNIVAGNKTQTLRVVKQ